MGMNVEIDKDDYTINKIEEIIQLLMQQNELTEKQNNLLKDMTEKMGHCSN